MYSERLGYSKSAARHKRSSKIGVQLSRLPGLRKLGWCPFPLQRRPSCFCKHSLADAKRERIAPGLPITVVVSAVDEEIARHRFLSRRWLRWAEATATHGRRYNLTGRHLGQRSWSERAGGERGVRQSFLTDIREATPCSPGAPRGRGCCQHHGPLSAAHPKCGRCLVSDSRDTGGAGL
jgi:hypothetical protein